MTKAILQTKMCDPVSIKFERYCTGFKTARLCKHYVDVQVWTISYH